MDKCLRSGRLVPRRIIALNISTARCCTADGRPVQGSSGDFFFLNPVAIKYHQKKNLFVWGKIIYILFGYSFAWLCNNQLKKGSAKLHEGGKTF